MTNEHEPRVEFLRLADLVDHTEFDPTNDDHTCRLEAVARLLSEDDGAGSPCITAGEAKLVAKFLRSWT